MSTLEAYKVTLDTIATVIEQNEIKGSIESFYSGRCMFGQDCLGVVMPSEDLTNFKFELNDLLAEKIEQYKESGDKDTAKLLASLKKAIRKPLRDNMGLDIIEYYRGFTIPEEHFREINKYTKVLNSN